MQKTEHTLRATQRIFMAQEAPEGLLRLRGRLERIEEGEAIRWLMKADTEADKQQVKHLYRNALVRYWTKKGYSKRWIDNQFTG